MSIDLDKIKKLSIRLIAERKLLIETLAAIPTAGGVIIKVHTREVDLLKGIRIVSASCEQG